MFYRMKEERNVLKLQQTSLVHGLNADLITLSSLLPACQCMVFCRKKVLNTVPSISNMYSE